MYLFILESIGTQELILIGIIALVVFGPRKLPEMARKLGGMMSEFRKVSGEFRSTWENAVKMEDLDIDKKTNKSELQKNSVETKNENKILNSSNEENKVNSEITLPEIKEVKAEDFNELISNKDNHKENSKVEKTNWL